MLHARADFDAIQPWPTKRAHHGRDADGHVVMDAPVEHADEMLAPIIPHDEPVLLVRGHDPLAYDLAVLYADRAEAIGCDPALVEAIRRHADRIKEWADAHPHGPADAPPGVLR